MSIPIPDALLVTYVTNFDQQLVDAPATYLVTPAQAAAFSLLRVAYTEAVGELLAAREGGVRSALQTARKAAAKAALLPVLRGYYAAIGRSPAIDEAAKVKIGVAVASDRKSRRAAPTERPGVRVESVVGRSVALSVYATGTSGRGGKAKNATHAYLFTFAGESFPADRAEWRFHGETTNGRFSLTLPASVPNGAQVWISSAWVSARGEVGPASNPVSTNIQGGGALPATTMQMAA